MVYGVLLIKNVSYLVNLKLKLVVWKMILQIYGARQAILALLKEILIVRPVVKRKVSFGVQLLLLVNRVVL